MSVLDLNYIDTLIGKAKAADSDAFAEFYAATYAQQYAFALEYLGNAQEAQNVLLDTYTRALRELPRLSDTSVVFAWLNQICMTACLKLRNAYNGARISPDGRRQYGISEVLTLPCTEAQALLLFYLCGVHPSDIAILLEISQSDVRRHLREGLKRLERFDKPASAKGGERT